MDRTRARGAFDAYVARYDAANPRIALKVQHTLRVAELCEQIARGLELPDPDIELAWLVGLLHDIGRFEQVRRYDTFNDAASVGHAALGVSVLFDERPSEDTILLREFLDGTDCDDLIRLAVGTHSDYRLPDGLDEREQTLCNILRDADKIDIIRVNCICPIEDIYGVSAAQMRASELTPACVDIFYQHRCLPRGVRQHPADILLGHICFAWEIVFDQSLALLREQGYLQQMLARRWDLLQTQAAFDGIAQHMSAELGL